MLLLKNLFNYIILLSYISYIISYNININKNNQNILQNNENKQNKKYFNFEENKEENNYKYNEEDDLKWYLNKLKLHETGIFQKSIIHILRLSPNEDLLNSLYKYTRINKIKALSIISAVGSLIQTNIRYANQENTVSLNGYFEIVSLVGNIDYQQVNKPNYSGSGHIHISCSDEYGNTIGGHLDIGNIVYTTVELTLLEIQDAIFDREIDDESSGGSGYFELKVYNTTIN